MSILSKLTVKPLLIACGVLLLAVGGLSLSLYVQEARHDAAIAEAGRAKDAAEGIATQKSLRVTELEAANANNQTVVTDLQARLTAAVGQEQATAAINQQAVAARDAARRERDAALARLQAQKEASYANDPDCVDWARRPVCGAVSRSLREQWEATRARATRP